MTDMEQRPQDDLPQLHLDGQLCFPLYAAARKVVNHYTPYLKPLGITYTQSVSYTHLTLPTILRV